MYARALTGPAVLCVFRLRAFLCPSHVRLFATDGAKLPEKAPEAVRRILERIAAEERDLFGLNAEKKVASVITHELGP